MLAEKDLQRSKVYREGSKFVYDGGDLPVGLAASIGCVLCLQRAHGISAPKMPGNAVDWIVVGGGSGGGGSIQLKTINGQSIVGTGNLVIGGDSCSCGFTSALKTKLTNMPTIVLKNATTLTINGVDFTLTPASTPVQQYTITVAANDIKMGTVSGGGTYASGATATLVATAASGYHFVSWQDGNTSANRTVTVTANETYTATFAADTPAPSTAHDYYAGFTSGTKSQFAAMTAAQLQAASTGYDRSGQPTYTHAVGQNSIFFLMWKSGSAPQSGSLVSGGITSPLNAEDFTDGTTFNTTHDPVTIDGVQYTVAAIRNTDFNPEDTFTVNF